MPRLPLLSERSSCELNRSIVSVDPSGSEPYAPVIGRTFPPINLLTLDASSSSFNSPLIIINGPYKHTTPTHPRPSSSSSPLSTSPLPQSLSSPPLNTPQPNPRSPITPSNQQQQQQQQYQQERDRWRGLIGRFLPAWLPARQLVLESAGSAVQALHSPPSSLPPASVCYHQAAWHHSRDLLAARGPLDRILIFSFEAQGEGNEPSFPLSKRGPLPPLPPSLTLSHCFQQGVAAIQWRPVVGSTLAIASRSGVCLWKFRGPILSSPSNHNQQRQPSASAAASSVYPASSSSSLVPPSCSMQLLPHPPNCPATAIAWSPSGRLLASASYADSTLHIWDVATGLCTPLRRGMAGICFLSWSPCGSYLLSSKSDGVFHLWESSLWSCREWSSQQTSLMSACWSPSSRALLLSFEGSNSLAALHFAAPPPSLDVQLLPLDLPELSAIAVPSPPLSDPSAAPITGIRSMAWDPRGERLVVAYQGGNDLTRGLLAVYDTWHHPIITASLIGFIRGPSPTTFPESFSFHRNCPFGSLLSVAWTSGECIVYPLIYRAP